MTRRPERLKATKLYAPVQGMEKSEQPDGNDDRQAVAGEPSMKIKLRASQIAERRKPKPMKPDNKCNVVDEQAAKQETKETSEINSNAEIKVRVPKGFVTRKEMEEKVKNRKKNDDNNSNRDTKTGLPKGFVTRAEMEQKMNRSASIKKDTQQKPSYDLTEDKSKMESKVKDIPAGLDTKNDPETRVQHRKTKATKVTPTYTNIQLPKQTAEKHSIHKEDKGQTVQQDANKLDPKAKYLFSKLENKIKGVTGIQEDTHSTDNRIPNQHQTVGKKIKGTAKALKDTELALPVNPVNRQADSESVTSRTKAEGHDKDKKKIGPGINDPERLVNTSARKSSDTITPRMTSTAIAKPTRGNAKSNSLNNVRLDSVKILIMNANGKADKGGSPTERRKNGIQNVVLKHMPNIVLFQEFSWTGITGKAWIKYPLPEHFVYKGHYDASIMYDDTCITEQGLPASDIDTILSGLQRNANNRLKRTFPMDFNPVARMCISRITAPTKPSLDFICISWHGKSNETGGGRMKELKKIEYFEYWMEFLRNIREKYKLPILAAGDYNVDMYSIEHCVQSPFKLCIYEASMRRTVRGIVDFCIVTDDIEFSDISWVNLERDTTVFHPNGVFDHDPIVGSLTVSVLGATDAALGIGKKKAWPSPISKHR